MLYGLFKIALILIFGSFVWGGSPGLIDADEIRIADTRRGDWGYPNPYRHYPRGPGYIRMSWVFDTLVWKDQNNYIPALARSWHYDPDKTAFVFRLNPKSTWHDGRRISADDVVFTIDYLKRYPYRWVSLDSVDRAEKVDQETVAIIMKRPYAPFISEIGGTMPILPKHIWQSVSHPNSYSSPKAFVGSGPYRFVNFDSAKGTYLYEAFNDYYQGRPKVGRLIYVKSSNPIMILSTGKAHHSNIKPDMAPLLKNKGMVVLVDKHGWNKKLMINHRIEPFSHKRFRQALAHAINQKEIIDKAQRGYGEPASHGLLSRDHEFYNPNTPAYPYDPAKTQELLESLGYKKDAYGFYVKGGRPLKVEILVSNITLAGSATPDRDGEVVRRQLEAAGIRVDLLNMEQTTTDGRIKKWEFELAISGHGGLLGDPCILAAMISSQYGAGSVNCARFDSEPELTRLLERQMTELNPVRRKQIVYKIQELYARELPAISLYYPENMAAYDPKKGVRWFYTKGGICRGIPLAQNKMSLIR